MVEGFWIARNVCPEKDAEMSRAGDLLKTVAAVDNSIRGVSTYGGLGVHQSLAAHLFQIDAGLK